MGGDVVMSVGLVKVANRCEQSGIGLGSLWCCAVVCYYGYSKGYVYGSGCLGLRVCGSG